MPLAGSNPILAVRIHGKKYMIKSFRQSLIESLWEIYCGSCSDMQTIRAALSKKGVHRLTLDHFAVIDLPGIYSGIPILHEIFSTLGFRERGKDYLAEKQNDFLWMAEEDCMNQPAEKVLPQVVIADFRLHEMPESISRIIEHYSHQTNFSAVDQIRNLLQRLTAGDETATLPCKKLLLQYLTGRDWPLPTVKEFQLVREFNELLAWVLVFGRRPNHFTLSVHLLEHFSDLEDFHRFIEEEAKLPLNVEGGAIKGSRQTGIAQGSTAGISQKVALRDGEIEIPNGFVEFVWRYPSGANQEKWGDYFTGFIATHADRVIESLYVEP